MRAQAGDDHIWDLHAQLLAVNADALHTANWQRAGDRKKKAPKPIPRPGVSRGARTGGTTRSPEEVARVLALRGPRRAAPDTDGDATGQIVAAAERRAEVAHAREDAAAAVPPDLLS